MINCKSTPSLRRRLIVTADDFGLDPSVNEAVERAWRQGILTAAGLMVSGPAAEDAINRARGMDGLGVGLHLVLTDGRPVLPATEVGLLIDSDGRFLDNMVWAGVRFFFSFRVRRQLAKEIRAQFEAFERTGLVLDHVSAHKHFHLHPTVLGLIIGIGQEYGMRSVRLPFEARGAGALIPWLKLMRRRLDKAGVGHNDQIHGLNDTGVMDESRMIECISQLAGGVTEMYCHPATCQKITEAMANYRHIEEFSALLSPRVAAAIKSDDIDLITFRDIGRG